MNLTQIENTCYRRLRFTAQPPAPIATRIREEINEVHSDICSRPDLQKLRDDTIAITATANKARTGLPPTVARVNGITDRTNNYRLQEVTLEDLRRFDPAQANTTSYPQFYAVVGNQPVQIQPAAATGLWAVSSSTADTTQKIYVETILTGGYPNAVLQNVTVLTGQTRVQIGARTDNIEVTRLYVDMPCAGFISLYDASTSGNELARLPIGETWSRYLAVEWWPIQTADVTEYADIQRTIYDLVNGTDEPLFPPDFHEVIIQGVLEREYFLASDMQRSLLAKSNYDKGVADIIGWVMNDGGRVASLRPYGGQWNRLGPTYPANPPWWQGY